MPYSGGHGNGATGTQGGGRRLPADFVGLEFALLVVGLVGVVAALVLALIAVAAVALLSRLHQPVAADGLAGLWKRDIAKFSVSP